MYPYTLTHSPDATFTWQVAVIRGCKDGTPTKHFSFHLSDYPEQSYDITKFNTLYDIKLAESLGLLADGDDVYESVDGCGGQYISTPALFAISQVACQTGHAIDRARGAPYHNRSDNDAAGGGLKSFFEADQKKWFPLIDVAAPSFAATCGAALESGFELKAVACMNLKRSEAALLEKKHSHMYTEAELDTFFETSPRVPPMKTAKLEGGGFTKDHMFHFRADPRDGLGWIRYRRWACACDVCWESPQNAYDTTGCAYEAIFGDMNEWHLIDLKPLIKAGERSTQATRQAVMREADVLLQNETDSFLKSMEADLTYAMQSKDD